MSKPDSWMPLFIGDYMADTMHLNTEEHGAYLLLLLTAWNRGGKLPNNDAQLALICRADKKAWARIKGAVLPFFKADGDFLVQGRLLAEYENSRRIYETKVANGSKGGRKKGSGNKPAGSGSLTNPDTPPGELQESGGGTQPQPQLQRPEKQKPATTTTGVPRSSSSSSSDSGGGEENPQKPLSWTVYEWEADRGKSAMAFIGGSPQAKAWLEAGVTEGQMRIAYDMAVAQRDADNDQSPLNPGFLDIFVGKVVKPAGAPASSVADVADAWTLTAKGIEQKGKELGVAPPDSLRGGFPAFKARVFEAAGLEFAE